MPTRRRFLQVGIAGIAVLAAARWLEPARERPAALRVLDAESAALVAALAPVVLAGSMPREAVREVVEGFDRAVSGLAPAVRDEIDQLLGLLRFMPTRWALTGVRAPLEEASEAQIAAFLERWRASPFDLLRAGCQALTQLLQASWYGNQASWAAIGYPGPPALRA